MGIAIIVKEMLCRYMPPMIKIMIWYIMIRRWRMIILVHVY